MTLTVVDAEGRPVPGAWVTTVVGLGESSQREPEPLGTTTAGGILRCSLDGPVIVQSGFERAISELVSITPRLSMEVELRLSALGSRVGVRSKDGRGIDGIRLLARRMDHFPVVEHALTTGEDGMAPDLLAPGLYHIVLERRCSLTVEDRSTYDGGGPPSVVLELSEGRSSWIELESHQARRTVLLVDAESGEPVSPGWGWLASYEEPPFVEEAGWIMLCEPRPAATGTGEIDLDALGLSDTDTGIRFCAGAPLHAQAWIDNPAAAVARGVPQRLPMERAAEGVYLRVVRPDGAPYARPITVFARGGFHPILQGRLTEFDGWLGPIPPESGPLEIHVSALRASKLLARVPEDRLEPGARLVVQADELGGIAVDEAPGSDLLCFDDAGLVARPEFLESTLVFDDLPAGVYSLGTEHDRLIRPLLLMEGIEPLNVEVAGVELIRVPWQARWNPSVELQGRANLEGHLEGRLYVFPLADARLSVPLVGAKQFRYPVEPDGSYRIHGFPNEIERLDFAVLRDTGDYLPVGSCAAGSTPSIRVAEVTISVTGVGPSEPVSVEYAPKIGELRGLRQRFGRFGSGDVVLGATPVELEELVITAGSRREYARPTLEPGARVHLDVDLAEERR